MRSLAAKNLELNNHYRVEGFINGQAVGITTRFKYRHRTMSNFGSEAVAVYNACLAMNEPKRLQDIIYFCELKGSGLFGTAPYIAGEFFKEMGCNINCCFGKAFFDTAFKDSGLALLSYWQGIRLHTAAVRTNEDGSITAYNVKTRITEEKRYQSISDMLDKLNARAYMMQTIKIKNRYI